MNPTVKIGSWIVVMVTNIIAYPDPAQDHGLYEGMEAETLGKINYLNCNVFVFYKIIF